MKRILFALACSSILAPSLQAAENIMGGQWPQWGEGHLTFYLDNDLFGGSDENYTNGARLSWISSDRNVSDFGLLQNVIRKFSGDSESWELFQKIGRISDSNELRYQYGVALTQLMYTPRDLEPATAPAGQRPYAGWAGLGFSLHTKDKKTLNSVELTLGILGEHAYAEQVQDFVHSARGIDKFNGWDSQIPDEPTVNIYFTQRHRLRFLESGDSNQFSIDGNSDWGFGLGNFRTDLKAGFLFRVGWNLPYDFSDPRLSETANSQRLFIGDRTEGGDWSLYFIGGARVNVIAHDATLDGPLFREYDTGVDKEWYTGEVYAGLGIRIHDWEASYVHTYRSKEYKTQSDVANFGSIALRYRF